MLIHTVKLCITKHIVCWPDFVIAHQKLELRVTYIGNFIYCEILCVEAPGPRL